MREMTPEQYLLNKIENTTDSIHEFLKKEHTNADKEHMGALDCAYKALKALMKLRDEVLLIRDNMKPID